MQQLVGTYESIGTVNVAVHKGAGYESAVSKSLEMIRHVRPDLIIVMAGVCDITWRNRQTKTTQLRYITESDIVKTVVTAAQESYDLIQSMHKCEISYATITGIDITDYNNRARATMSDSQYHEYCKTTKVTHRYQSLLDNSIIEINRRLIAFNKTHNTATTWTATAVHTYHNRGHHHYYRRLSDGCHPTPATLGYWVSK